MLTLVTFWWLAFFTAIGLFLGSFLNVVIFRLPRGQSVRSPRWSSCPYCHHLIRWYDNVPILSFMLLGGRCRDCRAAISTRYVVVEAAMALVVLLLLDAFFIGHVRGGLVSRSEGLFDYLRLTEQLAFDWPILFAHIILFACLLCMSAIDLEHYWVDVRFTNFAAIVGCGLHTLWTPSHSREWLRPYDTTAVVCVLALLGLALAYVVMICQPHEDPEDFGQADLPEDRIEPAEGGAVVDTAPERPPPRILGWATTATLGGLLVCLLGVECGWLTLSHALRAGGPLLLLLMLIVFENRVERESDQQIEEELEEERSGARRVAMEEFVLLLPAMLLGLAGLWVMRYGGESAEQLADALHLKVRFGSFSMMRGWQPFYGFSTAVSGFVIAGAIGWTVRIVFTLAFGKEAFGVGDIHLMAAAGCVAGWPVVLLGFFLTCGLAIVGWLLSGKHSRALPLGPWLAISFLIVTLFFDPIAQWPIVARFGDMARLLFP